MREPARSIFIDRDKINPLDSIAPPEIDGGAIRADTIVRDKDRPDTWIYNPNISKKDLPPVSFDPQKLDGVEVKIVPGSGRCIPATGRSRSHNST